MKPETAKDRILKAQHAMQAGVAMKMEFNSADTTPKHLRVGINAAMVEHSALAKLLIDKGIITIEEYEESLAVAMEKEVAMYEKELSTQLNTKVVLV